jgi:hypothetical protein
MYVHKKKYIYIGLQDMQSSDLAESTDVSTDMGTGGMDTGHADTGHHTDTGHAHMLKSLFTGIYIYKLYRYL